MGVTIEKIKDEINDEIPCKDSYNIKSWGADLSIRELVSRYNDKDMIKPELQRKYVWDKNEASYFVDSLLLGLPVPSIFLALDYNERWLIVDGYQRIMTVNDFTHRGVFSKDNKAFALSNSKKINQKWRGKTFLGLDENEKRRLRNTTIHAIIFEQKEPQNDKSSLYQIFERINASGRNLMPQEIRNCIYQGSLNSLLIELNNDKNWRRLFGSNQEDPRMRDIELILRFFALKLNNIKSITKTQISLKKHLNDFMGDNRSIDNQKSQVMKKDFIETMKLCFELYGEGAFKNISSDDKIINRFHPTIFDSISIATSHIIDKKSNIKDNMSQKRIKLLQNNCYQNFITTRTTNMESIIGRINCALRILYDVVNK